MYGFNRGPSTSVKLAPRLVNFSNQDWAFFLHTDRRIRTRMNAIFYDFAMGIDLVKLFGQRVEVTDESWRCT